MNALSKIPSRGLLLALALAGLGACSNAEQLEAEKRARHAAQAEREADSRLANLKQMQSIGRDDLALNFAEDLVQRFPGTKAATEAAALRDTLREKVAATAEATRLKGLWVYHDEQNAEAGGRVRSAYIYSSNTLGDAEAGKEPARARLVLRRHPQWGDDVYLLTDRGHFACPNPCKVSVQFDDAAPVEYPGKLPETGEPAMFVEDFVAIVNAIPGAKKVRFQVSLDDGSSHAPEFELGGYDPTTIGSPHRPAGG
jgi:hypothetical protein